MTILQVNKFYYRRGGADHHFLDLIDLLEEKGERVCVFSMKDKRNFHSEYDKYFVSNAEFGRGGLKAILASGRLVYSCEAKKKIAKLIKDEQPDIAHLHLIYHHLSPSILVALKKAKIPTVMTLHDWKLICPAYSLFTEGDVCERCRGGHYVQCFKHRCIKNSRPASLIGTVEAYIHHAKKYYENYIDLLIAPSQFVKDKFISFGWPEEKIRLVRHFLPINFVRATQATEIPSESRFAYIGRFTEEKGVNKLVDFWINKNLPYVLDLYGDGPIKSKIIKKIETSQLKSRIFVHGQKTREDIFAGLDHTTAIIIPSLSWETFGLTAIESFARGVPAIMSDRGALTELAKNSNAGILFDWDKNNLESALVEAGKQIYRDNAISYMSKNHLPDNYYKKIKEIYAELTKK